MSGSHRVDVIEKPKKQEWAFFFTYIFSRRNFQDGNLDVGSSVVGVLVRVEQGAEEGTATHSEMCFLGL